MSIKKVLISHYNCDVTSVNMENLGNGSVKDHRQRALCDILRDLVPLVQFKKREKHPWRSLTFSTKSNTPPWVFFTFLKLYK